MNEGMVKIAQEGVEVWGSEMSDLTTKQRLIANLNATADGSEQEAKLIDAIPVEDTKLKEVKQQMINANRRISKIHRDHAQALAQSTLPETLGRVLKLQPHHDRG